MKTKILYIVGGGHSGSTLLSLVLGSANEIFSLGEVYYYNSYSSPETDPYLFSIFDNHCTCNKVFNKCEFWKKVNIVNVENLNIIRKTSIVQSAKILWNMISPFDKLLSLKIKLGDDRNFFSAVEKTCSSRDEHFKYFLDSSKDPRRLVRLEQIFGKDNIVVIHLVRDIRGYVASYNSKNKPRAKQWGLKPRNFMTTGVIWWSINLFISIYIKRKNFETVHISYDLFCQKPKAYIKELNKLLKINIADQYIDKINNSIYHDIHGNWMRFKKIDSIKYDQKWRADLSWFKANVLNIFSYPLNKKFVYKDSITRS